MSGWWSAKRGLTSHPLFKGQPLRLAIWIWLLDNAAWKETTQDVGGKVVTVPMGSLSVSLRRLADEVGVGLQVVRTFMDRLEAENMITTKLTQGRTLISICNWTKYQGTARVANTAVTQDQHTKGTREQGKKKKEGTPSESLVQPTLPLPPVALPDPPLDATPPKDPPGFDAFWKAYPPRNGRKNLRGKAVEEYRLALGKGVKPEALLRAAEIFAQSDDAMRGFAPDACRWLKNQRWTDEIDHPKPVNGDRRHAKPSMLDALTRVADARAARKRQGNPWDAPLDAGGGELDRPEDFRPPVHLLARR